MGSVATPGTVDPDDTAELPALSGLLADDVGPDSFTDTVALSPATAAALVPHDSDDEDDEDDDLDATREAPFMAPTDAAFADNVRDVERWIEAQRAHAAATEREIHRLREAEAETLLRASTTAVELSGARELLATERTYGAELASALATHAATIEAERARSADLATALQGRDAALQAIRDDLAAVRADLERRTAELATAQATIDAERTRAAAAESGSAGGAVELQRARAELEAAARRAKAVEADLHADLAAERERAATLLERLQRRDFSRGAIETVLREREADLSDALARVATLESERDRSVADLLAEGERAATELRSGHRAELETLRDAHQREIAAVREELDAARAELARGRAELRDEFDRAAAAHTAERLAADGAAREAAARADERIAALESARASLAAELEALRAAHAAAIAAHAALDARLGDAGGRDAHQAARIAELETMTAEAMRTAAAQSEAARAAAARAVDAERGADEARRAATAAEAQRREYETRLADLETPRRALEAELARTSAELVEHRRRLDAQLQLEQQLRTALDRTNGALEERESTLAALERRAATSAYALGRIKTTMERAAPAPATTVVAPGPRWVATLTRSDEPGEPVTLGRTMRVGRAPDNDLRVEAVGVSRYHAVLTSGSQGTHVEDLNSTNGIRVNGRRAQRQRLNDGDHLSIGTAEYTFHRVERTDG